MFRFAQLRTKTLNSPLNEPGTSMAVFSSRGPTWDGRIKPDVVAPGWTFSARSQATQQPTAQRQVRIEILPLPVFPTGDLAYRLTV